MKSKILFLLIIVIFESCSFQNKNDYENFKLNGKVNSVRETTYQAEEKFGEISKGEIGRKSYDILSKDGLIIFNQDGKLKTITIYETHSDKDEIFQKLVYKYTEKICSEVDTYSSDGELEEKITTEIKNGKIIKEISYDSEGKLKSTLEYKYGRNNNKKQAIRYDSNSVIVSKSNYEYSNRDKVKQTETFAKNGKLKSKGTYDKNGNLIEYVWFKDNGKVEMKSLTKYDENNFEIENTLFDDNHEIYSITKYEYSDFDENGNWLKRVQFDNDGDYVDGKYVVSDKFKAEYIVEREITYY
ncbi:MAG TPA: hypothetical protein VLZ83_05690 [Edaphocola sp.]|nr:hypothetical protein [Edaphocola sp.]